MQSDFHWILLDIWWVVFGSGTLVGIFMLYALWKKLNKEWLGTLFTFFMLFFFVIYTFLATMAQQIRFRQVYFTTFAEDFYFFFFISVVLAALIFVVYGVYNKLLNYPIKK